MSDVINTTERHEGRHEERSAATQSAATQTSASPALEARALTLAYGAHEAVRALSVCIAAGTITALVGPNGSGKSTVLKALARILAPRDGGVYLDGQAIARLPTREVARRLAILPQGPQAPDDLTVGELVEQGRYPHVGPLRMLREEDERAIGAALEQTATTDLRHRRMDSLSGGERQRAWIALALAQQTPLLLLDEPTTFLDLEHQHEVLSLVRELNRARGMTILLVLHDLNQAARYADRMVAIQEGRIVADGTPREVLTPQLLAEVFHVQAQIVAHPVDGIPVCLPYATR